MLTPSRSWRRGPRGGFFALMGALKSAPTAGDVTGPFSGTAHLRRDGFVHFGVQVHGAVQKPPPVLVEPFTLEGILNPPAFTSGTATASSLRASPRQSPWC